MPLPRLLPLATVLLLGGCLYHVREQVDQAACDLALKPYDLAPPAPAEAPRPAQKPEQGAAPTAPTDVTTAALLEAQQPAKPDDLLRKRLTIGPEIPGSEAPAIDFRGMTDAQRRAAIERLYPKLEPLPELPATQPGPEGRPYTLADLQQLAATYSPALKQALADLWSARGNLLTARAYPNPTLAYEADPNQNNTGTGMIGFYLDQSIKTGGKLKLQEAAARMDVFNAELAVQRARSDLSTQVRNAYFAVLVAREAMRVNRALARLTDEVYRIQVDLTLESGQAAAYEPAALRAQAETTRLALAQSITTYRFAWLQLVAAVGLRERDLPLSELAGRVDANVPHYDPDQVLAHVLSRHTDVLIAQNGIQKGRYNLKLAQVTPWFQDVDVQVKVQKDFTIPNGPVVPSVIVGTPLSIWDQNKGNIIAAEGALDRALEQPHAARQTLTGNAASALAGYRNNLAALEYYRRILPQLVIAYRGVFNRRAEVGAQGRTPTSFGDLVSAQQALTAGVTQYLTVLGQLWTSVVGVADLLQTDDLFQLARPEALPPIPDLDHLLPLPCEHGCPPHVGAPGDGCAPAAAPAAPGPAGELPPPTVRGQAPADPEAAAPPTPTFAPAALPGPYFEADQLLDRPPLPPPGWFAGVELGLVSPHINNHLRDSVTPRGATTADTVALPGVGLDWTAFPRFEAGYRLPSGFGACSLSYRFLDTEGSAAALHSRLSLNEIGLDYDSDETSLWPDWDMKWTLGLRLLFAFFDTRLDATALEQRESNWYGGVGPHAGLELDRQIGCTGLAFILRGGGSLYLGRLRQGFFEQSAAGVGETREAASQAVPSLATFVGVRWQPPAWDGVVFYLGYQFEHWWDIGKNDQTASRADLGVQGAFVRGEWRF